MLRRHLIQKKFNNKGQNIIEYMLIFAAVIIVVYIGLTPTGFLTQAVNTTLEMPFNLLEDMSATTQYNLADE